MEIIYPTTEEIINYNKYVLEKIKVKKADAPKVLSELKLREIISKCENLKGDVYDKASLLLEGLIQGHVFASGNGRTALFITIKFLLDNKAEPMIKNEAKYAKVLTGIREGFYSRIQIKNWLKNGQIQEFSRN